MIENRMGAEGASMGWGPRTKGIVLAVVCLGFYGPAVASAGEFIFLRDGRVLQADKTEILGNTVRFETPAGAIVSIPRQRVLSIHPRTPPAGSLSSPAQVYGSMTQQMNDQVRQEIQHGVSVGQR
jgi:hypothetical protein